MSDILIYTKSTCPFCHKAKDLFNKKGVKFSEIDIGIQTDLRKVMIDKANGKTTVPQIFINQKHIGGCDDLYALEKSGVLNSLL